MESIIEKWQAIIAGLGKPARLGHRRFAMSMHQGVRVFAILPEGPDRGILEALFRDTGWALTFADTLEVAVACKDADVPAIILYDRRIPDQDWRQSIRTLSRLRSHPCVILLSPTSDRNLWDELQYCGGSDILRSPIEPDRALQAVSRTWRLWQNQQEVRSPRPKRQF